MLDVENNIVLSVIEKSKPAATLSRPDQGDGLTSLLPG